jgi:hypothetical protein
LDALAHVWSTVRRLYVDANIGSEFKMLVADFVSKIEWEGGIIDALEYGLTAESLDEGEDDGLRSAWAELESMWLTVESQVRRIESLLEKYEEN